MSLTEEQRAAIKLAMKYIARWPFAYKELHARGVLQAMIDSSEHIREPLKMVGFDLEKARAMICHYRIENPGDADTDCGLEDLIRQANLAEEALDEIERLNAHINSACIESLRIAEERAAEIERLRAALDESEQILAHKTKTATHWYEEGLKTRSDLVQSKRVVEQQAARLKELESSLDEAEALTKKNADLMNAYLARIAELEDALVEGLTNFLHYRASCYDPARRCPYAKECDDCSTWDACGHVEKFRSEARQLLQAEGKIGPDDSKKISHLRPYEVVAADLAGMLAKSWQITEERKAAIQWAEEMAGDCKASDVLRGMLVEVTR